MVPSSADWEKYMRRLVKHDPPIPPVELVVTCRCAPAGVGGRRGGAFRPVSQGIAAAIAIGAAGPGDGGRGAERG